MSHVVYVQRTGYREVIADYSGSPRHAAMSLQEWQNEFAGSAYDSMRVSYPSATPDVTPTPVTIGLWLNDWSAKYTTPYERMKATSNGAVDFDGVPARNANGSDLHTLTLQKIDQNGNDVTTGSESIRILSSFPIGVSNSNPSLTNGTVTVTVGPMSQICDVVITAADPAGTIKSGEVKIRFK